MHILTVYLQYVLIYIFVCLEKYKSVSVCVIVLVFECLASNLSENINVELEILLSVVSCKYFNNRFSSGPN